MEIEQILQTALNEAGQSLGLQQKVAEYGPGPTLPGVTAQSYPHPHQQVSAPTVMGQPAPQPEQPQAQPQITPQAPPQPQSAEQQFQQQFQQPLAAPSYQPEQPYGGEDAVEMANKLAAAAMAVAGGGMPGGAPVPMAQGTNTAAPGSTPQGGIEIARAAADEPNPQSPPMTRVDGSAPIDPAQHTPVIPPPVEQGNVAPISGGDQPPRAGAEQPNPTPPPMTRVDGSAPRDPAQHHAVVPPNPDTGVEAQEGKAKADAMIAAAPQQQANASPESVTINPQAIPSTAATVKESQLKTKLAHLRTMMGQDGVTEMIIEHHLKQAALGTGAKRALTAVGGLGLAGGGAAAGAHMANKDEPAIAGNAFARGYEIGQQETAAAIFNHLSQGGPAKK